MSVFRKAKQAGQNAAEQSSKALGALKRKSMEMKERIPDLVPPVSAKGFGGIAKKALDKSTGMMLATSVRLFNKVVVYVAESPKYYAVTSKSFLLDLESRVESEVDDLSEEDDTTLVRLRAVFSNQWETLELGAKINEILSRRTGSRIEKILVKLTTEEFDATLIRDPQLLSIIESFDSEGLAITDADPPVLREAVTKAVNADQYHFDKVYEALELVKQNELEEALPKLRQAAARPHYLVHRELGEFLIQQAPEKALVHMEVARTCCAGDIALYNEKYADSNSVSSKVLAECRVALVRNA